MSWLKIPLNQLGVLDDLNASAPTNFHIEPALDSVGDRWLSDSLRVATEYSHFSAWLSQNFTEQTATPMWPFYPN